MNNLKIGVKLSLAFGIAMVAMLVLGLFGYSSIDKLNTGQDSIYICGKSIAAISNADSCLRNIRGDLANMCMESFADQLDAKVESIKANEQQIRDYLEEYKGYLNGNQEDTANLTELETYITAYENSVVPIEEAAKAGDYDKAADLIAGADYQNARAAAFDKTTVMINWNLEQMQNTADDGTAQYDSSVMLIIIVIIVAIVIVIFFALIITMSITSGMSEMKVAAGVVADGDLTIQFSNKILKRKDEVGELSGSLNVMKENMHKVISQIVVSSQEMGKMVDDSNARFVELNDHIQEISSATEELSAGMEETAASSEELNATMQEVDNAVETVSTKATDGAKMADGIAERAGGLKVNFTESKHNSDTTFTTIQGSLLKSLEDAKAVEQINSLADAILGITSQTNLLALNAAIEAARAGDAGKGFAVVAEEIRNLAENSKGTATQILEVAEVVVKSVDLLVGDANKLLDFVEKDVTGDYNTMLDATDDYSGAANDVNDMTSDLSATAEELQASIQTILQTINEVSRAATEGATTTTNIAEQVGDVTLNADNVMKNLAQTKESAMALSELVKGFKI